MGSLLHHSSIYRGTKTVRKHGDLGTPLEGCGRAARTVSYGPRVKPFAALLTTGQAQCIPA
jgi:hypothetical protein